MKIYTFRLNIKKLLIAALLSAAFLLIAALAMFVVQEAEKASAEPARYTPVLLLDAGHGGEDGGAVGLDGVVEKDINLPIALQLNDFMRVLGFQTQMTRETDTSIHDKNLTNLHERKVSDIHNRFKMQQSLTQNDLFISIHQNKFPSSGPHGTQVFYGKQNPASARLAESVQSSVVALLQPDNTRQIKPSGDSIYLLYNAKIPAVMAECGFLSNPSDKALLITKEYQQSMAFAIAAGILDYCAD